MINGNNLLVVGLIRDSARALTKEVTRIEKHALRIFTSVSFFLVESDSKDDTPIVLQELNRLKPNFSFTSLGTLSTKLPDRFERLRFCRNRYVQEIRENAKYQKCNFILVVDFDIKNRSLDLNPLESLLQEQWWSALFANQKGPYYDILALRKPGWIEVDCFKNYESLAKTMSRKKAKELAIFSQMRRIPLGSELIEVKSAFGGLGIYLQEIFQQFDYSLGSELELGESEHISLHQKITNSGGKLFIVPKMTNFSYAPHNLSAYKSFRALDRLFRASLFRGFRRMLRRLLP